MEYWLQAEEELAPLSVVGEEDPMEALDHTPASTGKGRSVVARTIDGRLPKQPVRHPLRRACCVLNYRNPSVLTERRALAHALKYSVIEAEFAKVILHQTAPWYLKIFILQRPCPAVY